MRREVAPSKRDQGRPREKITAASFLPRDTGVIPALGRRGVCSQGSLAI